MFNTELKTTIGSVDVKNIPRVVPIAMIITCIFTYYMATTNGEVEPFPHCSITMTATPFPQNIVFRLNMMFASGCMVLIWAYVYFWLQAVNKLIGNPMQISKQIFWGGEIGTFFFMMAVATIDDGYMNDDLHGACAVIFFVIWFYTVLHLTLIMKKLKQFDHRYISDISMLFQDFVCVVMIACWVYEIYHAIERSGSFTIAPEVAIIQWITTFCICLFFWSVHWDFREFYLVLQTKETQSLELPELTKFERMKLIQN